MEIAGAPGEFRKLLKSHGGRRVLVPTMGALHEGHLELIRLARREAGDDGTVLVSIFVNPIQFDRKSDLSAYPRPLERDMALCRECGVDLVFVPEASGMYLPDHSVIVRESLLSGGLCGATRPGHFDGVCTVVLKLFLLSGCDAAVFGEKDFQQLAIIRRMVRDLDVPVEIIEAPTVRETDGLAMSSRNVRLTTEQRLDAGRIYRALANAARLGSSKEILDSARAEIEASPFARIDYLSLVDGENLQTTDSLERPSILATAVFFGEVRLIDHVAVPARGDL